MDLRSLPGRWWVTGLLGLGLTAYLAWRLGGGRAPENVPDSAPAGPAIQVSVDFRAVRTTPAAALLINAVLNLGDQLSRWLALLQEGDDLERMDLFLDSKGVYMLARGAFTTQSLRQSIERAGGRCAGSLQEYPCTLPADPAGCMNSVFTPANGRFSAACAASVQDAEALAEQAAPGAPLLPFLGAGGEDPFEGVARLTVDPARLEPLMREPPPFVPNLSMVARALEKASRAEFLLKKGDKGFLYVHLEAVSRTESEAKQLHDLLAGLNEFGAAAADFGQGEKESSDWSSLLRSARFAHQATTVTGVWTIDPELLRRLTAG